MCHITSNCLVCEIVIKSFLGWKILSLKHSKNNKKHHFTYDISTTNDHGSTLNSAFDWSNWDLSNEQFIVTQLAILPKIFIGARSEVVEGVIVEENSVISMGVYIGQSTKIYDRATGEVTYGRIPSGSVVVSGNLPSADGKYSLYCAVIVKRVDAQTRAKTSLNDLLRD